MSTSICDLRSDILEVYLQDVVKHVPACRDTTFGVDESLTWGKPRLSPATQAVKARSAEDEARRRGLERKARTLRMKRTKTLQAQLRPERLMAEERLKRRRLTRPQIAAANKLRCIIRAKEEAYE